jgi:hypothetical protein
VETLVQALCQRVDTFESAWEQTLGDIKANIQSERESRQKESGLLSENLQASLREAANDAAQRIEEQSEKIGDLSRCVNRVQRRQTMKEEVQELTPNVPRIRAELVEAALNHDGYDLEAQKKRLELMREALTPGRQANERQFGRSQTTPLPQARDWEDK